VISAIKVMHVALSDTMEPLVESLDHLSYKGFNLRRKYVIYICVCNPMVYACLINISTTSSYDMNQFTKDIEGEPPPKPNNFFLSYSFILDIFN
jgi:hypothetical protein